MTCTFFPDGNWLSCCDAHDMNYSSKSKISRKQADEGLRSCVAKCGHPLIAKIMYAGVRLFGRPFYKGSGKRT